MINQEQSVNYLFFHNRICSSVTFNRREIRKRKNIFEARCHHHKWQFQQKEVWFLKQTTLKLAENLENWAFF